MRFQHVFVEVAFRCWTIFAIRTFIWFIICVCSFVCLENLIKWILDFVFNNENRRATVNSVMKWLAGGTCNVILCGNFFPQNLHLYGHSPVWLLICTPSASVRRNFLPHTVHTHFPGASWITEWFWSWCFVLNL